ncbi:hypothetical protein [Massilia sp. S19_KUP03_FR1]|uniref:hypothetical protein n=1 Tax=Massilia sp. S19_KUP03_FR1 TaxID=3025503 RepID=UPI002FCCD27B
MNNEMKIAAPITAGGLVKIAHELIDNQHGGNNISKNQEWMRAGFKTGVTTMCMSVIEALPEWQDGYQRPTPAHRNHGLVLSDVSWPAMRVGERKAGTVLDIETGVVYDLMLMPGRLEDVTREQALAILNAAGGDLPSQCEMLMLEKLLGTATFETDAYWTKEKVKFEGDDHESHSCFVAGYFDFTEPYDEMRARGVRRISIGDVANENLGEVGDNAVIVPAPAVPAKAVTSASQSWGLATAHASPASPAAPEVGAPDSGLLAEKMSRLVTRQRRACDLLEAMGSPQHVEAAGDLRCATGDLWDAVHEQVAINALPAALDNWMTTPAGLARVLVGALRGELIEEAGQYNEAVEDCIVAVVGTLSAGAGGDKEVAYQKQWVELSAMAPKVPVDDIAEVLARLQVLGDGAGADSVLGQTCTLASSVINGLIPHAGFGVEA